MSLAAARYLHLTEQGLLHNPQNPTTKNHLLATKRKIRIAKTSWEADYFSMGKLGIEIHPDNLAKV